MLDLIPYDVLDGNQFLIGIFCLMSRTEGDYRSDALVSFCSSFSLILESDLKDIAVAGLVCFLITI